MSLSILQRIAAGDEAAVTECLDEYGGLVWSLARRLLARKEDAEDAVQDVMLELWKQAHRFDPGVASEVTFVAMIARRRLIDRHRSLSRKPAESALDESVGDRMPNSPVDIPESDEAKAALEALDSLRPEQRQVLRLSLLHGHTYETVSQVTGMPLGTVKTHARRGLIQVREILKERGLVAVAESVS